MTSLYDLLMTASPEVEGQALQDVLRKRGARGAVLAGTGDRVLAPMGQGMQRDAQQQGAGMVDVGQARLRQALGARQAQQQQQNADREYGLDAARLRLDQGRVDQDAWGAVADPVTGGIVMFNKKTGEVRPLGPGGGQPKPDPAAGPLPGLPGKPTEGQRTRVLAASESISQLDMAIDALKKAPGAYGGVGNFVAGLAESAGGTPVQSLTSRRYNPEELRVKNYVSNVVSKIINERAGANVTLREELRQKFLPQDTDGLDQAQQKLTDLRAMMGASYEAQGSGMVPPADGGKVKVRRKSDGKPGSMPVGNFNPELYEKIE
jgi:hypothetical protein